MQPHKVKAGAQAKKNQKLNVGRQNKQLPFTFITREARNDLSWPTWWDLVFSSFVVVVQAAKQIGVVRSNQAGVSTAAYMLLPMVDESTEERIVVEKRIKLINASA